MGAYEEDLTMEKEKISKTFTILTWNIENPSLERAIKPFSWLQNQAVDVFVLTECKRSKGCLFMEECFQGYGLERYFQDYRYHVVFQKPLGNEYGVLIASKHKLTPTPFSNRIDYLPNRVNSVNVSYFNEEIEVIGLYLPSRGGQVNKRREKKKNFVDSFLQGLEATPNSPCRILCGDFNILEPDHSPHYPEFEDWEYNFYIVMEKYQLQDAFRHLHPTAREYSWIGLSGNGYRYDHCFVSLDLLPLIEKCYYFHEPRELKLSDHSALITVLNFEGTSMKKRIEK